MKKETKKLKKTSIKIFYETANTLSKMKIEDIEDVKKFYLGINDLASQITSSPVLIKKLKTSIYDDDQPLFNEVAYILGYGLAVEESNIFTEKEEIKLDLFIKETPQMKSLIVRTRIKAILYFKSLLEKRVETLEKTVSELQEIIKKVAVPSFWVTKDNNGNYFFDGKRIYIKNKDADYAIIFDIIYSLIPLGGKIEYKKILEQCKKEKLKNVNKKSILRALTGKSANLFRYVEELKQKLPFGANLFVAMHNGKEIEFCNQK